MPEIPQIKKFPYKTDISCKICHPADQDEPPKVECHSELVHAGTVVQRTLICPNCSAQDTDLMDTRSGRVVFNREMDLAAARGGRKSTDIG